MRAHRIFSLVCAAILLPIVAHSARAQQDPNFETGLQSFKSYHGGNIDTINLSNGGLTLDIPIISYPQRGGKLDLNFVLHYWNGGSSSTEVCYDDGYGDEYCYPAPASGSDMCYSGDSYLCHGFVLFDKDAEASEGDGAGDYWLQWPDGTTHPLAVSTAPTWSGGVMPSETLDGSAFKEYFYESGYTPLSVGPDGTNYILNSGVYSREDVNGNEISTNPWTDTLDRSIPAIPWVLQNYYNTSYSSGSGATTDFSHCSGPLTITSAVIWTPPGLGSGTYPLKFCYVSISETEPIFDNSYTGSELQSVVLPDNTTWTFQYTSDTNADLASVTFPTGGSLSYSWYNDCVANYGYTNPRLVLTRSMDPNDGTTPDSTWDYSYTSPCYYNTQTIVTSPSSSSYTAADDTVHTNDDFGYETQTKYYQGSHSSGSLLKTVNTAYRMLYPPPSGWSGSCMPYSPTVAEIPSSVITIWPNNQQSETAMTYDSSLTIYDPFDGCSGGGPSSYGRLVSKQEYDYGTGAPGSLLRTTTTSYLALSNSSYLSNNLLDLVSSVQIKDGGGTQRAYTTYAYEGVSLVSSGITTQHSSSPPAGSYPGNLTSVSRWLNTTSGYLTNYKTYYDTGMVQNAVDANGSSATDSSHMTTYTYDSTGGFLTQIQYPTTSSIAHIESFTSDFDTGLLTSHTDQNSQETTYTYDPMLRPLSVSFPDGGHVGYCYTETGTESGGATCSASGPPYDVVITQAISSGVNKTSTAVIDGVGRLFQAQLTSDPSGTDYTDYRYDGLGRKYSVSNPHRSGSSATDGTTYYSYDPLNRVTTVTEQDGSTVTTSYADSTSLHAFCTTVTDEAGKKRESCTDGPGRMTSAWEDPSGSNFETDYTYDSLDNLTGATQKGGTTSSYWRTRSFTYDSLSRLLTASNPESGTICYGTYSGSTCQSNGYDANGNLIYKTDARSITTTYAYDALNRLTGKSYSNSDPSVSYSYDAVAPTNCTISSFSYGSYPKPLRTAMCDAAGTEAWSYDSMGRVATDQRTTDSVTKTTTYATTSVPYNYDGSINTLQSPSGRAVTYTYNAAGQPITTTDSDSNWYTYTATYWPTGAPYQWWSPVIYLRNDMNNRLQPSRIYADNGVISSYYLDLSYSYGSQDNGNVMGITNNKDSTRSQTFTYDSLNRIATAAASTYATSPSNCWGESYTIDPWGNLTGIGSISSAYTGCTQDSLGVSATAQNQLTTGTTPNFTYDAAGNLTSDGTFSATYDAENRISSIGGVTYYYDGDGKRVWKSSGVLYWYGTSPDPLLETDGSGNLTKEYIFFAGKRIASLDSSSNILYYLADHLGSARVVTNASGTIEDNSDFYPYGGQRVISSSSGNTYKFEGKIRDSESGLDDFGARFYSSQYGRFMIPDWAAKATAVPYADFGDPQTLNLYGYVRNNPLSKPDIDGHCFEDACVGEVTVGIVAGGYALGFVREGFAELINKGGFSLTKMNNAGLAGALGAETTVLGGPVLGSVVTGATERGLNKADQVDNEAVISAKGIGTDIVTGGISKGADVAADGAIAVPAVRQALKLTIDSVVDGITRTNKPPQPTNQQPQNQQAAKPETSPTTCAGGGMDGDCTPVSSGPGRHFSN